MSGSGQYLFAVCQVGAEQVLKAELARHWPAFRLSYSRPGLVTFKWGGEEDLADDFDVHSVFARTYGFSLGRLVGPRAEDLARQVWEIAGEQTYDHLHVWQRDTWLPGERGFEPGVSTLAAEVASQIVAARPPSPDRRHELRVNQPARPGNRILDCLIVEPGEWLVGQHRAVAIPSRFPGGVCVEYEPRDVVSRAYWKMKEALAWSQLPVAPGDRCVEIGSSPGGSAEALLSAGLVVRGIDPAEMDERLLQHPRFTHIRKRASDLKRREFRDVRWLVVDSNLEPPRTLKMVEDIVTHREVHIRGLLVTLKLPDWELAQHIPEYVERVRSWGYRYVRARQLAFNRHELCVAALTERAHRRAPPHRTRRATAAPRPRPDRGE